MPRDYTSWLDEMVFSWKLSKAVRFLILANCLCFLIRLLFLWNLAGHNSNHFFEPLARYSEEARGSVSRTWPSAHDPFTQLFWLAPMDALGVETGRRVPWLWQFVSYTFLHEHIPIFLIINMFFLWWCGIDVEDALGPTRFLVMYFLAGIASGVCCCLFGYDKATFGATGGVLAVMVAFAVIFADGMIYPFSIPVKVKYIVYVFIAAIAALVCLLPAREAHVIYYPHLAGILTGYLFVKIEPIVSRKLLKWRVQMEQKMIERDEHVRERVDELLEKVNTDGFEALTRRERSFLKSASKRFRKRGSELME